MALTQISTAGVKDDAVTSGKIPANAVGSSELADNAVDTAAIAADAVTGAKIADDAVAGEHIADNSISTAHIQTGAVTTTDLADNAVTAAKIAAGAVSTTELSNSGVSTNKLADDAVTSAKIAAGAVSTTELSNSGVTTAKIADQAVTLDKLPHGTSSNNGKFLRANNGADPTFETVSGTTINNNANNRVITGSDTANTLEGEPNLTFTVSGSDPILTVQGTSAGHAQLNLNTGGTTDHCGVNFGDSQQTGIGRIQYTNNGDYMILQTNGAERMRVDSSGNVGIATNSPTDKLHVNGTTNFVSNSYIGGDLYMYGNSYGNGIFLGGSGSANKLDDYEEGSWTPNVANNGSGSYSARYGWYTKVGNIVHLDFYVHISSASYGVSYFRMSGVPFTSKSTSYACGSFMSKYHTMNNNRWYSLYLSGNNTTIVAYGSEANADWEIMSADSTFEMIGSITYRI